MPAVSRLPPPRQGRDCAHCRQLTARLLLARGRPGAWLLVVVGLYAFVLIRSLESGLA